MFGDLEKKEIKLKELPVQYIVVGKEICPKSGKQHLQGYLYYGEKKSLGVLKKKVDDEAHWTAASGTPQENAKYCKKGGDWWEQGTQPVMGARTDLDLVAERVRKGASLKEIAEDHPGMFVLHSKGFAALQSKLMKDRNEKPDVTWIWGETGSGKTKFAVELCDSFYMKDGTVWWDGYEQQKCIIIDDFDGKWPFRDLLRLLDRYPYQGQTKGGYVKINSPNIVITCEFPPKCFWEGSELKQVMRRITKVIEQKRPEVLGNTIPEPLDKTKEMQEFEQKLSNFLHPPPSDPPSSS